jgi:PLP dependent protein
VASRLDDVRARIRSVGGDPDVIRIVSVTKGFGEEEVRAALAAGLVDLGENYAQELIAKAAAVPHGVRWHFLGPIQRNKLPRLAPLVAWWHAVDREAAIDALGLRRAGAAVLLQLNPFGEPGKHGCPPEALPGLAVRCRERDLDLRGVMVVGTEGDPVRTRAAFQVASGWADRLGLPERSMGMTDDFEIAVEEGATILRLGRALFGPREPQDSVRR